MSRPLLPKLQGICEKILFSGGAHFDLDRQMIKTSRMVAISIAFAVWFAYSVSAHAEKPAASH